MFRIDIVETDSDLLDSLQLLFDTVGWQSRGYLTAEAFLDAPSHDADCLLIGAQLSDMSVLVALQTRRAPTIALTERRDSPSARALAHHVSKFIAQPVSASQLIEEISSLLGEEPKVANTSNG